MFAKPVTAHVTIVGSHPNVTMFWSKLGAAGFDNVGGTTTGSLITASNTHFSDVFAGEGSTPGSLAITPSSLDFGTAVVGTTTTALQLTVHNVGGMPTAPITVAASGANAADFTVSAMTCGPALAPDATCTASVTFSPSSAGVRSAQLAVVQSGQTTTAALAGTGVTAAALALAPSVHDYGSVPVGANATQTFTITNMGGSASGTPTVALTGTDAAAFAVTASTCTAALPAAGSCTCGSRPRHNRVWSPPG